MGNPTESFLGEPDMNYTYFRGSIKKNLYFAFLPHYLHK